jgi:aminoglycoside 6-adenylyltransferase
MRSEQEMLALIIDTAKRDDRVRAVILNGSRANPNVERDIFQDFDIVYFVNDVAAFRTDPKWIRGFGELMIMQTPEAMRDPPPTKDGSFSYLMLFTDGNRIDLTLHPISRLPERANDSLSLLLLDKDNAINPLPPANEKNYLPQPPTAKAYADCCNEFWWVCTYVAKGLWRGQIIYAKSWADQVLRPQLMKMVTWQIGVKTQFSRNPGEYGKYIRKYLEPDLWEMLEKTYSDAEYENTWEALTMMCNLFRITAIQVAEHFAFEYPNTEDKNVVAHLDHVRHLPRNAKEMY